MATVTQNNHTFDEFCDLVRDGKKADLIDGVIHLASPENTDANGIFVWLLVVLDQYVRTRKLGKVFGSRVACKLSDTQAPEPDILFLLTSRLHLVKRGRIDGRPDVAIEIVSPDSIDRDYKTKRKQYRQAGIPEYWIIDEMERKVTLLRLDDSGKYRTIKARRGVLTSEVIEGFWIRTEWLWPENQPLAHEVLAEICDN